MDIETPRTFVENHTGYGGDKFNALVQDITARDALLRADERRKAAERVVACQEKLCAKKGGCDPKCTKCAKMRATITIPDTAAIMADPEEATR